MPTKQWRCFHCDQVFRSEEYAREHFGIDQFQLPACKLTQAEGHLVGYIRKLEMEIEEHRRESHATLLAAYSYHLEATNAARKAEERGYDKGVADAMSLCQKEKAKTGPFVFAKSQMGEGTFWSVSCCCKRCGFPLVDWCPIFGDEYSPGSYTCPHCRLTDGYWADAELVFLWDEAGPEEEVTNFENACDWMRRGWRVARRAWADGRTFFHDEADLLGKYHALTGTLSMTVERLAIYQCYPLPAVRCALAEIEDEDKSANDWYVFAEESHDAS